MFDYNNWVANLLGFTDAVPVEFVLCGYSIVDVMVSGPPADERNGSLVWLEFAQQYYTTVANNHSTLTTTCQFTPFNLTTEVLACLDAAYFILNNATYCGTSLQNVGIELEAAQMLSLACIQVLSAFNGGFANQPPCDTITTTVPPPTPTPGSVETITDTTTTDFTTGEIVGITVGLIIGLIFLIGSALLLQACLARFPEYENTVAVMTTQKRFRQD